MTVLDAHAVLALLKDEPAADPVECLIRDGSVVSLTTLGVAEVVDHLVRLVGAGEDDAMLDMAQLGLAAPLVVDEVIGVHAGLLRARHYHRRERAVSMADCVAAEVARSVDRPLATSDPHLLDTCAAEAIDCIVLPDSSGTIWSG